MYDKREGSRSVEGSSPDSDAPEKQQQMMRFETRMGSRMSWPQIRQSDEYRGRWVALDNCRYDGKTAQPVEGTIIDADEDLVELCTRIRHSENKHCAILFCDETPEETPPPSSVRRPSYPPAQH
jgi:hypothetical protein